MAKNRPRTRRKRTELQRSQRQLKQIDELPDDVLLEIFEFYTSPHDIPWIDSNVLWEALVHVCRRWRGLVFASPRRLNLRLWCTPKSPAKDTLDVWPALPLIINGRMDWTSDTDNIIAALGKSNRVYQTVLLGLLDPQLERILAAMQVPFPELTEVRLWSWDETQLVIPDLFLDGSAPFLRVFELRGIPFPGFPKLLLSATHLTELALTKIPHSGYISPEAIIALISVLPRIERLSLEFQSPQSIPDRETQPPPPSKRSVIPALVFFRFKGVTEYLEDLVTGIDTPQLDNMYITFFNQIDFDTPRLAKFVDRTPKLTKRNAHLQFYDHCARVMLRSRPRNFEMTISCQETDWQLSSIEQVCDSCLNPLSTVQDLYIEHRYRKLVWKNDAIENTLWLQLLRSFIAVKNLYLSKQFAPGIGAALQELVGGRVMEVLPNLQNIFVGGLEPSGHFREKIGQFVAARQLSDRPIAISIWDNDR